MSDHGHIQLRRADPDAEHPREALVNIGGTLCWVKPDGRLIDLELQAERTHRRMQPAARKRQKANRKRAKGNKNA